MKALLIGAFFIYMTIGVYSITSPSGRVYVGSSVDVEKRFKDHTFIFGNKHPKLYASFKKYGIKTHKFKIEIECEFDELFEWEHHYSNYYDSIQKGLNCRIPGFGDVKGLVSEETKDKLSKRIITDKRREQCRISAIGNKNMLGKKHSEGTKQKLRDSNIGNLFFTNNPGKNKSKEWCDKIALSKIGNKNRLGKTHSQETKDKISQTKKQNAIKKLSAKPCE